MKQYEIQVRSLPLDDNWDVIVAGGGPAGCAAATAAAREGAKTLLLEATGVLGGMGTAGLVPWFCGYGDGEKVIARGLADRVRLELADGMPHLTDRMEKNPLTTPAIDPELLKRIYDDMVTGAGAEVLFNTQVCSVEKSSDSDVDIVIVSNKNGLTAFRAKVYIDCTGDGDIAAWAGAQVEKGDESGGLQPTTACFILSNVDEYGYANGPNLHFYDPESPIWKAIKDDEFPLIEELHTCNIQIGAKTWGFNTGHVFDVDNTDPKSVSAALIKGRRMAKQYRDAFAKYHPAFANSMLSATGCLLGVRETRRIMGDYVLNIEDYRAKRSFPDEICRNAYGIDVHSSREEALSRSNMSIEELKKKNSEEVNKLGKGNSVGVPYRCLTPKGLRNVIVAGRCISTDRRTNGTVRIMACCLNTGEAAGIAAATAASGDGNVHAVDTETLRTKLKTFGAYLP